MPVATRVCAMWPRLHVLCLVLAWCVCSAAAVVEEWNLPALPDVFPTPLLPASDITKAFNAGASGASADAVQCSVGYGSAVHRIALHRIALHRVA